MADAALAPYRVLDLTTERAWLTGKMLADLGAEVIKVEPPGGDPGRTTADLAWRFYNKNKKSIVLDIDDAEDKAAFLELASGADAVVESFPPGWLDERGIGAETLLAQNPALVVTSVTPYGQTGPHAHWASSDLVLASRCGLAWLTGDDDRSPVRISVPQMDRHGAAEAAVHTTIALYHAARTGEGQTVDVASLLAGIRTLMNATPFFQLHGEEIGRHGPYAAHTIADFRLVYPCADGHVSMLPVGGAIGGHMMRFLFDWAAELFDIPAVLQDVDFAEIDFIALDTDESRTFIEAVNATLERLYSLHTKAEIYEAAMENLLLLAPINTVADLRGDEQLTARGYWVPVDGVVHAGPWCKPSATPLVPPVRAPEIGEHSTEIGDSCRPTADNCPQFAGGGDVFDGLKVWDMSWVGVGPMTARYLADYGATVVRLDWSQRPDILRLAPPFKDATPGINSSQFYADFNASKYGIGLNIGSQEGREVARKLAAWADVVVESFTPHALRGLELNYASLTELNPTLVMLSTCMQGQTGPRADYRGFGNLMAALAGYYHVTGWPDRGPVPVYGAYTDFICQRFCTTALVSALDHRRRTGVGQHIDLSQFEAALQFLGPELLDYELNGTIAGRQGNRDPSRAPHAIYPCAGEDTWVAIACEDDEQWKALRAAMGDPAWARDPRFDSLAGRKDDEHELDAGVSAWTESQSVDAVVDALQPHVAAGPVHSQRGLYEDPQIDHLGYFESLEHTVIGEAAYNGMQATLSATPAHLRKAAPCVGEDSQFVLSELLGFDDDEIAGLLAAEVVEIT